MGPLGAASGSQPHTHCPHALHVLACALFGYVSTARPPAFPPARAAAPMHCLCGDEGGPAQHAQQGGLALLRPHGGTGGNGTPEHVCGKGGICFTLARALGVGANGVDNSTTLCQPLVNGAGGDGHALTVRDIGAHGPGATRAFSDDMHTHYDPCHTTCSALPQAPP